MKNDHSDLITRFKEQLELKNRQLEALKQITVTLVGLEDEELMVPKIIPVIQQVMDLGGEILLYAATNGTEICHPPIPSHDLSRINHYLREQTQLRKETVQLDFSACPLPHPFADLQQEGYSGSLFTPIYHGSADIGFMAVPLNAQRAISADDLLFLNYLGETIGIFLENIQLRKEFSRSKDQLEQHYHELFAVSAVSSAISADMEVNAILEKALETMLDYKVLKIEAKGGIFLVNEETGRLDLVCHKGISDFVVNHEASIPMGHCLCGIAAQSGEIITSENCCADPRHHTSYQGMQPHGHIILPLIAKEKVIGVLFLYLPADCPATKGQLEMLSAIANQLAVALENAKLYERVRYLSLHDPLTSLANRNLFHTRLKDELSRSRRYQQPLTIAMVDIDHFKKVNDTYGHPAGDIILRELALLLGNELRGCDVISRFGGEEFILLLPETDRAGADIATERIRKSVARYPFAIQSPQPIHITVSIGVAPFPGDSTLPGDKRIDLADKALYQAKEAGRNRVVFSLTA